jgi:hypothetical protein
MLLNLIMRLYYFPMPSLVFGTTVALDRLAPSLLMGMILNSLSLSRDSAINSFRLFATLKPVLPIFVNLTYITPVLTW